MGRLESLKKRFTKELVKDIVLCGIVNVFVLFVVILLVWDGKLYGSATDWQSQHWAIPEYFRTLFYENHQLFPSFAFNIGSGENIYNFSYYGLLSPIILISYLLPWVEMITYIQVVGVLTVLLSVILFYVWLRKKYNSKITFCATFIFACGAPLIFHSHRHIMFMCYMPLMIFALMGVESYFKKGSRVRLILSVFLIIMSSYFFSVGAIAAVVVYGVKVYLDQTDKFNVKQFLCDGMKFAWNIIIAVMMAGVTLLPTAYTLFNGRNDTNVSVKLSSILLPTFNIRLSLYYGYSIGLSAVYIFSIIYMIYSKKKSNVFLGIVLGLFVIVPAFSYILNGTMYVDGKALIPFLPIGALIIAEFYSNILNGEYNYKKFMIAVLLVNIFLALTMDKKYLGGYLGDVFLVIVGFSLFNRFRKKKIQRVSELTRKRILLFMLIAPVIIISIAVCIESNFNDVLVDRATYENNDGDAINSLIEEANKDKNVSRVSDHVNDEMNTNRIYNIREYSTGIYSSICNKNYNSFFFNEICNNNPFRNSAILSHNDNLMFNLYMGNKYIIAEDLDSKGYKKVSSDGDYNLYCNEAAMPMGYATSKVMTMKEYRKLKYPYTVEALLKGVVVEDDSKSVKDIDKLITSEEFMKNSDIKTVKQKIDVTKDNDFICKENDGNKLLVDVQAPKHFIIGKKSVDGVNKNVRVKLDKSIDDSVMFLKFQVDNRINLKKIDTEYSMGDILKRRCMLKSKGDSLVVVNGIMNKLTVPTWKYYNNNTSFEYTISSNDKIDALDFDFYYGMYEMSDIESYTIKYDSIKKLRENVDELVIDRDNTHGDVINGSIDVTKDGYFKMSIPYDNGFKIEVDGKEVECEKTDTAFIGFPISKGKHSVSITYTAPLLKAGMFMSLAGLVLLVIVIIRRWRSNTL